MQKLYTLTFIFMIFYFITSIDTQENLYVDEITSSIPNIFTLGVGDILNETDYFPKRTIIEIKLEKK